MSKVYSFRLSDDNPREVQAREVIEAWVEEGYSLRFVIIEALLCFSLGKDKVDDLDVLIPYLEKIIDKLEDNTYDQFFKRDNEKLSSVFVSAVKNSAKSGLGSI